MDESAVSLSNLTIIETISAQAHSHFVNKLQNHITRFVFCGLEKLNKILQVVKVLYPMMTSNQQTEFSLGILLRSIMMDCVMVQKIKHSIFSARDANPPATYDDLLKIVIQLCTQFVSDGTEHLIKDIYASQTLSEAEKSAAAARFAGPFSEAFDLTKPRPSLKKNYKFKLSDLIKESTHRDLITRTEIYDLYKFYSKYDHLSHYSSLARAIPFERRKGKVDLAILLSLFQLRDLLVIARDFDPEYLILDPFLEQIQRHLHSTYDNEIEIQHEKT